jgi:hypothetical protein
MLRSLQHSEKSSESRSNSAFFRQGKKASVFNYHKIFSWSYRKPDDNGKRKHKNKNKIR